MHFVFKTAYSPDKQVLLSRLFKLSSFITRIHGIIRKGGEAPNIIPDYTSSEYFVRAAKAAELKQMISKVKQCFEAGAHATGCQLKIEESRMFYDVNFNETLCLIYQKHMERLGAHFPDRATQEKISRGSTDMGNVTYEVPGTIVDTHSRDL